MLAKVYRNSEMDWSPGVLSQEHWDDDLHEVHELVIRGCTIPRRSLTLSELGEWLRRPILESSALKQLDYSERELCAGIQGKHCERLANRGGVLCEKCYAKQYRMDHSKPKLLSRNKPSAHAVPKSHPWKNEKKMDFRGTHRHVIESELKLIGWRNE